MSMGTLTDQELIAHYLDTGSPHYFAQIYTRHRKGVYRRCLAYTGNKDDAEDFVQDIFMRLTLKLGTYKGDAKFTTWLQAIAVNYCLDQRRKQQKDEAHRYTYALDTAYATDWTSVPNEVHEQAFEQALNQLSPNQRELLLSKYKAGARIQDIASSQDLTLSAVKMRIKRARLYVRSLYNKILSEQEYLY